MPDGGASTDATSYHIAIVGGGPRSTYALERLSATVQQLPPGVFLTVTVFELTGEFGAGLAHSPSQARSSHLNRISCQIGFAADEHVPGATHLRPKSGRPTLHEWCRREYERTGNPDFDVQPDGWPKRYVHGLALQDMFSTFVGELAADPRVEVQLVSAEVTRISETAPSGALLIEAANGSTYRVDEVLLTTGHPYGAPEKLAPGRTVPFVYPLTERLSDAVVCPDTVVGCVGTGLTAIDVILYLTEGRGGRFLRDEDGVLQYCPSGYEPREIVACSQSGLFTFARPVNLKSADETMLENSGTFLTPSVVDRLREALPCVDEGKARLDFDSHVLPIVVLEMAYLHYMALYGPGAAPWLRALVAPCFERFVVHPDRPGSAAAMQGALEEGARALGRAVAATLGLEVGVPDVLHAVDVTDVTVHWFGTVYGESVRLRALALDGDRPALAALHAASTSPWMLSTDPRGNEFDYPRLVHPIEITEIAGAEDYARRVLEFMQRDRAWAAQGNLLNPYKAATDGTWRDLREVICHAVDGNGLTARSQREFHRRYVRLHNRVANGAALEVMERIEALLRHGILDLSTGPDAEATALAEGGFVVRGPHTGAERRFDVWVEARIRPFDPRQDPSPLYADLVAQGLARLWCNQDDDGETFIPGGLDLDDDHHPYRRDGGVVSRLTVLGPAALGRRTFLMDALKPGRNHYVMRDVVAWCDALWARLERSRGGHGVDGLALDMGAGR